MDLNWTAAGKICYNDNDNYVYLFLHDCAYRVNSRLEKMKAQNRILQRWKAMDPEFQHLKQEYLAEKRKSLLAAIHDAAVR